jgi:F0F1-type ATP synthase membrane subunit c/vacuolar-type H+-ATPase subunit K
VSFLGDVIVEILGGALQGVFSSNKPAPYFPEGEANASLGAAAGLMAFVSLLISVPTFILAISSVERAGSGSLLIVGLGVGSSLLAIGTIRVGSKALRVTKRNAALSKSSRAAGYLVMALSAASSIFGVIGILRWIA